MRLQELLSRGEAEAVRAYARMIRPQYSAVVDGLADYLNRNQASIVGRPPPEARPMLGDTIKYLADVAIMMLLVELNELLDPSFAPPVLQWRPRRLGSVWEGTIDTTNDSDLAKLSVLMRYPAHLPQAPLEVGRTQRAENSLATASAMPRLRRA